MQRGTYIILPLSLFCAASSAQTPWEVAVIFSGASIQSADYQKDIDANILELARRGPKDWYRLSLYREYPNRSVYCHFRHQEDEISAWDPFFHKVMPKMAGIPIPCKTHEWERGTEEKILLRDKTRLRHFFSDAFQQERSNRLLLLYGHGFYFEGTADLKLKDISHREEDLRTHLRFALPRRPSRQPLDLFWLDMCFGANLEAIYELREFSSLFIGSEDAEFSAASPLENLQVIREGPDDPTVLAKELARSFIESYSYLLEGSQHHAVSKSPATLSVIDAEKLEGLVGALASFTSEFPHSEWSSGQRKVLSLMRPGIQMSDDSIVDLGRLILAAYDSDSPHFKSPSLRAKLKAIRDMLEVSREKIRRRNPRVTFKTPEETESGLWLVYGYENWIRGHQEDDPSVLNSLPRELKGAFEQREDSKFRFIGGENRRLWPARWVERRFSVAPFTVGFNVFDFVWADENGKILPYTQGRLIRPRDYAFFEARSPVNPVLFSGYTHADGRHTDRYTGLSVLNPIDGSKGLSYSGLEFHVRTGWGKF